MTVQSVRRGGPIDTPGPASDNIVFMHADHRLRLVLPPQSKAGQELTLTVRYRGMPDQGLGIGNNIHGERTFFANNWPNQVRHWLPMIDHPYDKATGEFVVSAPSHYQVVANGVLVEEIDLPQRRAPHALEAVGAGRVVAAHAGRGPLHRAPCGHGRRRAAADLGVPAGSRGRPQAVRGHVAPRDAVLRVDRSARIPYEKLANIQATGFTGGTEYASAIFYGEKNVAVGTRTGGPRNRAPVVRRLGHRARLG